MWTRRTFLGGSGTLALALLSRVRLAHARSRETPSLAALTRAIEYGRQLRTGSLQNTEWQDRVEEELKSCSVEELAKAVALGKLRRAQPNVKRGAGIMRVRTTRPLLTEEGSDMKVFFFKKERSDPPHCHFNLVAAHIVLEGKFRVRHYDRVREQDGGVVLRPTRDRIVGPGDVTSISDDRDNAHWRYAETDGILLDVQQGRIDPTIPIRKRQMLDLNAATKVSDDLIWAPHMTNSSALRKYGK